MADIAQLGISVDSTQVKTATAALTGLAGAAKPAAASVAALQQASAPAAAAALAMGKAAATASSAHAGLSTQAMAAFHSIRSMAESLAMGLPPTQALAAQMNHLSYAASGPGGLGGAFKEAGAALTAFISPTTAVVAGLTAIAAGSVFALSKIAATEKGFGQLSEQTGLTVQALHGLASAAAEEGIGSPEFIKGMTQFNALSTEANHNVGALAELFRANGAAIGDVNQNLTQAANLIQSAATNQDKYRLLQELGLPATREWVQFLGQGNDQLRQAALNATQFGNAADEKLIQTARDFDKAWNTVWNNFTNGAKAAFVSVVSWFQNFSQMVTDFASKVAGKLGVSGAFASNALKAAMNSPSAASMSQADANSFYNKFGNTFTLPGAGKAGPTINPQDLQKQIALEQQRIGILGQTATVEQQVRAVELQIQAARLQGVNITDKEAQNLKRLAQERALGIDQIHASTDSLNTEIAAFGMDVGQAASYTAVQNKINEALRAGVPLRQDQIDLIRQEANILGDATQKLDNMKFASDTLGSAMKDFRTQIANGATTMQALQHAALTALNAIEDKLIDMAAKKLVEMAFSSGGTNFLSFLTPTAHGGYGPGDPLIATRAVSPAAFFGAPRFHSGIGPGERPAIIRDDESVLTPGQMKALGGAARGGGNVTIAPTINVQGGAPGDDASARKFAGMIADNVRRIALETIRDQRRPGGLLA